MPEAESKEAEESAHAAEHDQLIWENDYPVDPKDVVDDEVFLVQLADDGDNDAAAVVIGFEGALTDTVQEHEQLFSFKLELSHRI